MKTMRSARKMASAMSWVTMSTVVLDDSMIPISSSCMDHRVSASNAPKGSSISRMAGSFAKVRAIATRCFMPPDNWLG